jgi:hypothetical protein
MSQQILWMNRRSVLQDTALIGCCLVAVLAIIGVLIASVIGEPPVAYLTDLFTDPSFLFPAAIGLYFSVTAYRRAKAKSA